MTQVKLRALASVPRESEIGMLQRTPPPDHLFHYTSASGLIGIATTRKIWASGIQYLNDQKELMQAAGLARQQAENLGKNDNRITRDDEDVALCDALPSYAGHIDAGVYITSFSVEGDDLSQWRAYCPPPGGFALAVPGQHLRVMTEKQGFYLAPCVYDHEEQVRIVNELIYRQIRAHFERLEKGADPAASREEAAKEFGRDISRFGPLLKHRSFAGEREWRLVSAPLVHGDARLLYRAGPRGIVPYVTFDLMDATNPLGGGRGPYKDGDQVVVRKEALGVVVGPTRDSPEAQHAVQALLRTNFGDRCWHGRTDSSYRGP